MTAESPKATDASSDVPVFHVLALSGGGYRGLYSAAILRQLEETLGKPLGVCAADSFWNVMAPGFLNGAVADLLSRAKVS